MDLYAYTGRAKSIILVLGDDSIQRCRQVSSVISHHQQHDDTTKLTAIDDDVPRSSCSFLLSNDDVTLELLQVNKTIPPKCMHRWL